MKRNCLLACLFGSFLAFAEQTQRELGNVTAIERTISVNLEACLSDLKLEKTIVGGPYYGQVIYRVYCEKIVPNSEGIIFTDSVTDANGDLRFYGNAKRYAISAEVKSSELNPKEAELLRRGGKLISGWLARKLYTVKAITTGASAGAAESN